jgi:hypothetical protein
MEKLPWERLTTSYRAEAARVLNVVAGFTGVRRLTNRYSRTGVGNHSHAGGQQFASAGMHAVVGRRCFTAVGVHSLPVAAGGGVGRRCFTTVRVHSRPVAAGGGVGKTNRRCPVRWMEAGG